MSWLLALALLCLALLPSNAKVTRKPQLPSATVVGTVYCPTCLQNDFSEFDHFISGALVAVECDGTKSSSRFRKEVKTNKHGQFKVNLPFSVTKHVKNIKKCSVYLVRSNDANCAVASTARTSSFHLKSIKARSPIFSAGFLTFKPLTQPNICNQRPNINENSKDSINNDPSSFPPPLQDPPSSIIPPIDDPGQFAPLPILPRLPPLPNLPPILPPKKTTHKKTSNDLLNQKTFLFPPAVPNPFQPPLVPNPLQPPPAIVPPVIPSPPPSIFPPVFPSPPPSVFPPVLPTPPHPPPSIFPPVIPAPPVSPPSFFPPIPGFPGVPPAATSSHSKETKHP